MSPGRQAGFVARLAFLLLVFVNLVFFVWAGGYLGRPDGGREPERLKTQLNAERLRLVGEVEPAKTVPPPPLPEEQQPAPAPAGPANAEESPDKSGKATDAAEAAVEVVCRRVGPMAGPDAATLKAALAGKAEVKIESGAVETSYWVHVPAPASGSRGTTDKAIEELKAAGIKDYFVVTEDGPTRGAISLGLYHQEDAAKDFIQRLARKGIKSAQIAPKERKTDKVLVWVRGGSAALEKPLAGLKAEPADCPPR